ncbi:hypothetical protein [Butyrivibrio sp. VCB2006]|uniref:hypothetical protein n=1 Tax=Butyrivibrio sp. VCB2006 TaxID=1280679 RepID=UPI0012DD0C0A|nr:hypothetical protein [Butyrivibrio sp. VCB2006]
MLRKSLSKRIITSLICLIMGMSAGLFPKINVNAYNDTVQLQEDTYNTLIKGTTVYNGVDYAKTDGYNPLYYFLNYADLRAAFGADPYKLVEHWALHGKAEKRTCNAAITRGTQAYSSKTEYIVPSYQLTSEQKDGLVVIPEEIHSNGGMNARQDIEARNVAKQLAQDIYDNVSTNGQNTQIEMVTYATAVVRAYCNAGKYTETGNIYRTAYGVFIGHEYSSAGATRALGLILDYLDQIMVSVTNDPTNDLTYPPLKWVHVNANQWTDQWCQVVCDNHEAYADPISGYAGYGKNPRNDASASADDIQHYVEYSKETDVKSTRPPLVEGNPPYKVTQNKQKNSNSMSGNKLDSYYTKYNK